MNAPIAARAAAAQPPVARGDRARRPGLARRRGDRVRTVRPLDTGGLIAVTLVAAVWLLSLRAARPRAPYALGPWVPAAIGRATGLVCVAAVNPYLPGLACCSVARDAGHVASASSPPPRPGSGVARAHREAPRARRRHERGRRDRGRRPPRVAGVPFEIVRHVEERARTAPRPRGRALADARGPRARSSRRSGPTSSCSPTTQSCSAALERLLDMTDRRFRVAGLTSFYEHAFGCVPLAQHDADVVPEPAPPPPAAPGAARPSGCSTSSSPPSGLAADACRCCRCSRCWSSARPARSSTARRASARAGRRFTMYKFRTMPRDRGAARRARVRPGQRPARVGGRALPAPDAPGRAAAALERPQGRHVDRRAAPRAARVRRRCSRPTSRSGAGAC